MQNNIAKLTLQAALLGWSALAAAQTAPAEPSAQQIIDALHPKPVAVAPAAAKPRRTRNLSVEEVPADSAPAASAATSAAPAAAPAPAAPPAIDLAIQFDLNSDHVRPDSLRLLGTLAEAMQAPELRQARFLVEGHTDGTGQPAHNLRLSAMRAVQVKRVLVQRHVDPDRIVTEGKGSSELVNPAVPGAPENRRVRIVILGM